MIEPTKRTDMFRAAGQTLAHAPSTRVARRLQ